MKTHIIPSFLLCCVVALAAACDNDHHDVRDERNDAERLDQTSGNATSTGDATEAPAGEPNGTATSGALQCDDGDVMKCTVDADCGCGKSRSTGQCAYGTASCLDMTDTTTCSSFCTGGSDATQSGSPEGAGGLAGRSLRCVAGRCSPS